MGYTLKIGEYQATAKQFEEGETYLDQDVEIVEHEGAPAYGEPTDNQNQRWPSYTTWADFTRATKLEEIFTSSEGNNKSLLREHPGCFPLTQFHKKAIDKAFKDFKKRHPSAIAAMSEPVGNDPLGVEATLNATLARLTWLKYWVDWSLENCKLPVFYNS